MTSSIAPLLAISARDIPPIVEVRRTAGVPDVLWSQVLAHWGASGNRPNERTTVAQHRFLADIAWLLPALRRSRVGVTWDDRARELVSVTGAERGQLAAARRSAPLDDAAVRGRLTGSRMSPDVLQPFQLRDLRRLLALPHGANFSVPGAGKTAVTYAVYEAERAAGRVQRLLVVGPLSAFEAWRTEAARWLTPSPTVGTYAAGDRHTEVLLVTYNRLLSSYEDIAAWVAVQPTHVVLDEAHRVKRGRGGQWGSASLDLARIAVRRDVLTGTPAPQHPRDLAALLDFCWPGQGRALLPQQAFAAVPPAGAMRDIQVAVAPLFVRTTKAELHLPAMTFNVQPVPLEGLQAQIYALLRNSTAQQYAASAQDQTAFARMGRVVMYLLEAATNPALLAVGSSRNDPISFQHPPLGIPAGSRIANLIAEYGTYETPPKFAALARIVADNAAEDPPRKTLVWSNFVRNLEQLATRVLPAMNPAVIHGGVPPEATAQAGRRTREQELSRFRHDPNCTVLLANPAAMGEGVSLHDVCHDAIYLDRTFNAGQYLQSLDRIHRLGLPSDTRTNVTFLITTGTVDETVDRRIRLKAERLSALLDDPALTTFALPDEEDYGPVLDNRADLTALFVHLRGQSSA